MSSLNNSTALSFTMSDLGSIPYIAIILAVLCVSLVLFISLICGIVMYSLRLYYASTKETKETSSQANAEPSSSSSGLFNRNRWVMIGLSLAMLVFRTLGMIFCIVSKSFVISMRSMMEHHVATNYNATSQEYMDAFIHDNSTITGQQAGVPMIYRELDQGFYSLEIFFTTNNVSILLIAMCFIGNIFLKTVIHAKGETQSKGSKILLYLFNIMSVMFCLSFFVLIVALSVISPLFWLKILSRDVGNTVFYILAVIFGIQLLIQCIFSIVSFSVVRLILNFLFEKVCTIKVSMVIKEMGTTKSSGKALIKVTILQLILLMSAFIFLIGSICYSIYGYYMYLVYIILINIAVVVFVSVILAISKSSA